MKLVAIKINKDAYTILSKVQEYLGVKNKSDAIEIALNEYMESLKSNINERVGFNTKELRSKVK